MTKGCLQQTQATYQQDTMLDLLHVGVPFCRGRFQPLPLVAPCQGPRGRGKNNKWNWTHVVTLLLWCHTRGTVRYMLLFVLRSPSIWTWSCPSWSSFSWSCEKRRTGRYRGSLASQCATFVFQTFYHNSNTETTTTWQTAVPVCQVPQPAPGPVPHAEP